MTSLSDLSLVTQVTVFHDRRAFDRLVVKYQSPIRRLFLSLTGGNEATSDDLAQETFIKAYTHLSQFRATATFQTWLYRIAYNVFYDHQRKHTLLSNDREDSQKGNDSTADHTTVRPSDGMTEWDSAYDLQQAMAILSESEHLCITLQLIEGHPIDEIAKMTGMAVGTVKSHLSRGKTKLANFLRKNGYENRPAKR